MSNLKLFGCSAFVYIPLQIRKKFDAKSEKTILFGYPEGTKGYKRYDPAKRHFVHNRDIIAACRNFYDIERSKLSSSNTRFNNPDILTDEGRANSCGDTTFYENSTVGEMYEDSFMEEIENLPPLRKR